MRYEPGSNKLYIVSKAIDSVYGRSVSLQNKRLSNKLTRCLARTWTRNVGPADIRSQSKTGGDYAADVVMGSILNVLFADAAMMMTYNDPVRNTRINPTFFARFIWVFQSIGNGNTSITRSVII